MVTGTGFDPAKLGFHANALVLRAGLFRDASGTVAPERADCIAFIKTALTSMFPANKGACWRLAAVRVQTILLRRFTWYALVTYSWLNAWMCRTADAPRLSDPGKRSTTGFYTPYFQTFTFEGVCTQTRAQESTRVMGLQRGYQWIECALQCTYCCI